MMHSFDDVFDEMFDAAFGRSLKMVPTAKGVEKKYCVPYFPPCKVEKMKDGGMNFVFALAGYSKEDLKIDFENWILKPLLAIFFINFIIKNYCSSNLLSGFY